MLKFHQTEVCEGIIRHLEAREREVRREVHVRDVGASTAANARVK
jgi:hypothetical protein